MTSAAPVGATRLPYAEWVPDHRLDRFVVCSWTREATDNSGPTDRILPDGCVDIVWNGSALFVAGPATGPVLLAPGSERLRYSGVRFRPGAAPALLRLPACALRDQQVPLENLWGARECGALVDALAAATSTRAGSRVLERALVARLVTGVDPLAQRAVHAIAASPEIRVGGLARSLGVTDRTLHRRVESAVGYGPKVLQRVARFRRFLAIASRHEAFGLASLATMAGYADQAHLTRECRALSGLTPRQLVHGSDVRLVQDGLAVAEESCSVPPSRERVRS